MRPLCLSLLAFCAGATGASLLFGLGPAPQRLATRAAVPRSLPSNMSSSPAPLAYPMFWFAPIWSGSGYGSEAINFLLSLLSSGLVRPDDVWAKDFGGHPHLSFAAGMDPGDREQLEIAEARPKCPGRKPTRPPIVVCHCMPYLFHVPERGVTASWGGPSVRCPPEGKGRAWSYAIGRTMFETDRVTKDFANRVNAMDEVWVPSEWQRESFAASGVATNKLRVVPEGVNTTYFDPSKHQPLAHLWKVSKLVFGTPWARKVGLGGRRSALGGGKAGDGGEPFRFFSSFKWEVRKGWDVLLEAYLSEFTPDDPVELYILTKPWDDGGSFFKRMADWASSELQPRNGSARGRSSRRRRALQGSGAQPAWQWAAPGAPARGEQGQRAASGEQEAALKLHVASVAADMRAWLAQRQAPPLGLERSGVGVAAARGAPWRRLSEDKPEAKADKAPPIDPVKLPTLYVIDAHLSDAELASMYAAADAFVLPSRGEGWGRPHVEAMAMGLPVIATNWSGLTAFLDETVGYPLPITGLVQAQGWPDGLKWAAPDVGALRRLMRRVVEQPGEAAARGAAARARCLERYSPAAIAAVLNAELRRVERKLEGGAAASAGGKAGR